MAVKIFFTAGRISLRNPATMKIDGHYALLSDLTWMLRAIYVKINEEKFSLTKNELSSDFNSSKNRRDCEIKNVPNIYVSFSSNFTATGKFTWVYSPVSTVLRHNNKALFYSNCFAMKVVFYILYSEIKSRKQVYFTKHDGTQIFRTSFTNNDNAIFFSIAWSNEDWKCHSS